MIITKIRLIIFFAAKDGETLYSQWKEDQELTVAQIMNSLLPNSDLKVGKTTRPCKYDLNQIPYTYTVEVTNRFKGLDLIKCLKNYGWSFLTLYRRQWLRKTIPKKKKGKKAKWLSEENLTSSWEKKKSWRQRRKGKLYPFECRLPKNSMER